MRKTKRLLWLGLVLSACGGGAPYIGMWQCAEDPNNGIEITRYEDYFIITRTIAGQDFTREGSFNDGSLAVGANHLGQAMALEIVNEKLICTHPPNFCQCNAGYEKASSLSAASAVRESDTQIATTENEPAQGGLNTAESKFDRHQLIADSEGFKINLHNGGEIQVFDHFRNKEYGIRMFDWPKLSYYYLPALSLAPLDGGNFAELDNVDGSTRVLMRLKTKPVDRFELIEQFHENVNTKIQASNVTPLNYQGVKATLKDAPLNAVTLKPAQLSLLENGSLDIAFTAIREADSRTLQDTVAAINRGERVPEVMVELRQEIKDLPQPDGVKQNVYIQWQLNKLDE